MIKECIKQERHILREIQRGMTDLSSSVGDLEHKRRWSSSSDRKTSERNISLKKWKVLGNESDHSVEDSDVEISNEETLRLPFSRHRKAFYF